MGEVLPPLFQKWIDKLLPEGIPSETRATCNDCAMIPKGEPTDSDIHFNPATKCCTYYPDLGNFIAGRILADQRPENYTGRRTVEMRLAQRLNVTPLGITPPPTYAVLYEASAMRGPDVFGRAPSLRCPFFLEQSGGCGIHQHRETVCSTFFCKYSRGPVGRLFWRALAKFLGTLEHSLRVWALDQIEPSGLLSGTALAYIEKKRPLDEYSLAGAMPPGLYERLWGPYVGKERELFMTCAEHVDRLDLDEAVAIGGVSMQAHAHVVKRLHHGIHGSELPARVTRGSNHLIQLSRVPNQVRIKSHSAQYDFVELPASAVPAAGRVADRPLAEARAELEAEGLHFDDETLRWLIDFEVLVPV